MESLKVHGNDRLHRGYPLLVGLTLAAIPVAAAEPGGGSPLRRAIVLEEAQILRDSSTGDSLAERRAKLTAEVEWQPARKEAAGVVLRGTVTRGFFTLKVKPFLKLESSYGFPLDGISFQLKLTKQSAALSPEPRGWAKAVKEWEDAQRVRRLPRPWLDEVKGSVLETLERAQAVSLSWLLLAPEEDVGSLRFTFPLRIFDGKRSGAMAIAPVAGDDRLFAEGRGKEAPVRRLHRPQKGKETELAERGSMGWVGDPGSIPRGFCLEARGPYSDAIEVKGLALENAKVETRHEVLVFLGEEEKSISGISDFTGLPARLEPEDFSRYLSSAEERRELGELLSRTEKGADGFLGALKEYAAAESERKRSAEFLAALHYALVERFAMGTYTPSEAKLKGKVERIIREESFAPLFIWALRAASHPYSRFPDEARVRLCSVALERPEPALARWGSKMLAHGRWKGALEILVKVLAMEEERDAGAPSPLKRSLLGDLRHRAMRDPRRDFVEEVRKIWIAAGTKSPFTYIESFDRNRTESYFRESGVTVFLLEAGEGTSDTTVIEDGKRIALPANSTVLDLLQSTLLRLIPGLPEQTSFGILATHQDVVSFPRKKLLAATSRNKELAADFVRRLQPEHGSGLLGAIQVAFRNEDLDTLVILGGRPVALSREGEFILETLNYTRGVRIVLYWVGVDKHLQRLAEEHFGWIVHILGAPDEQEPETPPKPGRR
jgi:hypothetical protein